MKIRILMAEDERALGRIVQDSLENQGFAVTYCVDGKTAWEQYHADPPDLCLLDVMMPWTDGFTLARKIKATNPHMPIIFLTAKSQTKDVLEGFDAGGDDYLRKPFSIEELIARIKALMKRQSNLLEPETPEEIQIGEYRFDFQHLLLQHPLGDRKLTHREGELLRMLYQNRQKVLEQKVVLDALWENDSIFSARSMQVFITKLRSYLRHDSSVMIINVRAVGYKLIC